VAADPRVSSDSPRTVRPFSRTGTPPLWLALLGALVLVLVLIDLYLSGPLRHLDHSVSDQMRRWDVRRSEAKPLVYAFTLFGQRGTVLGVSGPIAAFLCWRDRSWRIAALYIAALLAIYVVVYALKDATDRTAPPVDHLHVAAGASFPSGHLVNALVLWWLLATCAARVGVDGRIVRVLLIVDWAAPFAVLVAMTLLNYHWISDFVGGLCVGLVLRYGISLAVARLFRPDVASGGV